MFYFTDTNQIAIYEGGGTYQIYTKDSSAYSIGGEENLNYVGGVYNDSSSQYYLSVAPSTHFDMEFLNGVEKTDWLNSDGDPITTYQLWYGSSDTGTGYDRTTPLVGNRSEGLHSRHASGGGTSRISNLYNGRTIFVKDRGVKNTNAGYYANVSGVSTGTGDFTYMFVSNSDEGSACGVSYHSPATSIFFINPQNTTGADGQSYTGINYGGYSWNTYGGNTSTIGVNTENLSSVECGVPENGLNSIFVIRRQAGVTKVWGSAIPGSSIAQGARRDPILQSPSGSSISNQNWNGSRLGINGYSYTVNTYLSELLMWNTALNEADLDKVYLYLLNKYTFYAGNTRAMQAVKNDGTVGSVDISDPTTYNLLQV
jgi:hypothetical protein